MYICDMWFKHVCVLHLHVHVFMCVWIHCACTFECCSCSFQWTFHGLGLCLTNDEELWWKCRGTWAKLYAVNRSLLKGFTVQLLRKSRTSWKSYVFLVWDLGGSSCVQKTPVGSLHDFHTREVWELHVCVDIFLWFQTQFDISWNLTRIDRFS